MQSRLIPKPLIGLFWGVLTGFVSLFALWALASVESLQPLLLAPLGFLHQLSWGLFGFKIIPDGTWSTLFVSGYFFGIGPLVTALIYLSKLRLSNSSLSTPAFFR